MYLFLIDNIYSNKVWHVRMIISRIDIIIKSFFNNGKNENYLFLFLDKLHIIFVFK
jgi:hypothetical protein